MDIIQKQATINIGVIGHVAHGKSTLVKALTGQATTRHKAEQIQGITIKLGYSNAKIFKCESGKCGRPEMYYSTGSSVMEHMCTNCGSPTSLVTHVSFVDCPGHEVLMSTMMSGASVMDGAILLIAGNETCPQPQTKEHVAAVEFMGLKKIIIVQNKLDLIKQEQAEENYAQIKEFVKCTICDGAPIIPMCAQKGYNLDVLAEIISKTFCNERKNEGPPNMNVIRSFDINKPGALLGQIKGGIAGGTIVSGSLTVGQSVEIRPGLIIRKEDGNVICRPLVTKVTSLRAEENNLSTAVAGGLIGVGTNLDPCLCKANRLVGMIIGVPGQMPPVFNAIEIEYQLMYRYIGINKTEQKTTKIEKLKVRETLMINVGPVTVGGEVAKLKDSLAYLRLVTPVCAPIDSVVAISRKVETWRLIGYGKIKNGNVLKEGGN